MEVEEEVVDVVERLNKLGADGIRVKFREIPPEELAGLDIKDWIVQAKWDGWFVALVVKDGKGDLYSRACLYRTGLDCKGIADGVYTGELIENTQWSYEFKGGKFHGKLMLFDIYGERGNYLQRYQKLKKLVSKGPDWIGIVEIELGSSYSEIFQRVVAEGFEGIILVNTFTDERIKVKKLIEDDFVIMGFEESDSSTAKRCGGMIKGLLYGDGTKVLGKCGSMPHHLKIDMYLHPDKYLGKVVTIRGKERFKSGALRHPAFVCIRDERDKRRV